ncbi:hypothetical protein PHLCEN_2v9091 [Hermanssonia centrifuga]|uniref:Uncharacterized protein n=1 Tax=Hermanssonia centrifuga TaxID=98765 RepID=A0A2R6NRR8_9APHY|nr:hypothetical protein PHLCEN_2v9091 [Hermanssonia centrifuga]
MPFSKTRPLRGYWFPHTVSNPRYINSDNTRYYLNAGFDVPDLRTFFPNCDNVLSHTVTIDTISGCEVRPVRYIVFFKHCTPQTLSSTNPSLAKLHPALQLTGSVVVFRCSKVEGRRKLVNMHSNDNVYARHAVHKMLQEFDA